jgi:nitroreductase
MKTLQLLKSNRSYRRFEPRTIEADELSTLIEAARLCGSGANLQQLRFVPICGEDCARVFPHLRWAGYLPEWDGPVEGERPTAYMILLCPKTSEGKFITGVDVGLAAQSMLLTATDMGLGGCMFASIDREALLRELGLDAETWAIALVVALGEPRERVEIVPVIDGNIKYYRDAAGTHYVPKRSAQELTIHPKKKG